MSPVTYLPPATREEQLERWGITPDRIGARVRGAHAEDAEAHGYDEGHADVDGEAHGFLQDGGWRIVEGRWGHSRIAPDGGGMTAHRGTLHPEEHVDADALRSAVEHELGFTIDDVRAVYRQGKKSPAQLELRARIGARLLELSRAGGHMLELGRALGWAIDEHGRGANCRTMERALGRARKEHA
jgi:hypothetical protein